MTTDTNLRKGFSLGQWEVLPDRGLLRDGEKCEHLEPLVMRVLVALASAEGEVLSKDELIEIVWDGRALSDEPLNRCISLLRRKLGDDSRNPTYIQNIPRLGYRLMMPIQLTSTAAPPDDKQATRRHGWATRAAGAIVVVAALVLVFVLLSGTRPPGIRSVAIYPFSCAGITEEYLCFGFSEQLTSTLLHTAQIKIVKFREPLRTDISPQEVAQSLGVDGLLIGSVQQIGDSLKTTAELIDGDSGFTILSDIREGTIKEVFELQEQIASAVERALLGSNSDPVPSGSRPSNFAAFEAYARGQYQFERRSRVSIEESIRLFEESIRLDPNFGPTYLRLAYAYLLLPEYDSSLSIQSMYDLAAETTRAGITADPAVREPAGTVFGFIHHKRGEWAEADAAFQVAVNTDSVHPLTRNWYSKFLATVGRRDEALDQAKLAYEQAPDNATIISRLAITNLWLSDLRAAGQFFDIANGMGQELPIHHLAYGLYLIRMEDIVAARHFTKSGLEKYGFESSWVDPVYDGLENPALRAQSVALVADLESDGSLPKYAVMSLWAVLGEADRAFDTARSLDGIGQDFETGLELMFSDDLAILRQHGEFQQLLDSTGLTAYWAEIGCEWVGDRVRCDSIAEN